MCSGGYRGLQWFQLKPPLKIVRVPLSVKNHQNIKTFHYTSTATSKIATFLFCEATCFLVLTLLKYASIMVYVCQCCLDV